MTDEATPTGPAYRRFLRKGMPVILGAGVAAGLVVLSIPSAGHRSPRPTAGGLRPPIRLTGVVTSFGGCTDYLSYVRNRAEAMTGPYGIQTSSTSITPWARNYDGVSTAPGVAGAAEGAVPAAGPAAATGSSVPTAPAGALPYSQTNDQVAGVDEPDTVKTDGHVVVTLTGSTLRVLDPSAQVLGSVQLTGDTGGGLLLAGSRVLAFSAPATAIPGTTTAAESSYRPLYGPAYAGAVAPTPVAESAQVIVVDLTNPSSPEVVRTFHFDGSIVAARLVGQQVRLTLRSDGPRVAFASPGTQGDESSATAENKRLIRASTLTDWLPSWQVQTPDGAMTARAPLSSCDSIVRPDQASGISTVTVLSVDPQSSNPGPGTSIVAAGATVYATTDRLYVAGPSADGSGLTPAGQPYGCCSLAPPLGASTRIYAFDTPASGPASFAGEGTVPGWLVNSYAMDEDANGLLRVASTSEGPGGTSQSQITVLGRSGSALAPVGTVSGLGNDEFIRAVRFVGNQAYVVTFRTFDPLYVVDLSKPAHPVLAGELDQPGFSEFLYPLPGHRLLGVGVQLTANEPSGLVVASYDVSDPAHPRRIDVSNLAQGFMAQGYDPHAFLYWAATGLALLAVPDGGYAGNPSGVAAYQIGSGGQLNRTATLGHDAETATRSLVIGDRVWVTTAGGVVTAAMTDLSATSWHSY